LLSDRIALMTNSPEARLAESFAVNLPRPRTREAMIDTDEYTRLRSHILHFLMRGSHALATPGAEGTGEMRRECRHYSVGHHPEEECVMITRVEATAQLLAAKKAKGLTFEAIAAAVGRHKVWVTAALMGQATMSADEATAAARVLGLGPEVAEALQEMPMKGSLDSTVPVDPLIYRFHEITQVYGTTMKALIHEMFGDGIMSAIDFEMDIQKIEDPKGDRVVVTYNGKFLPYKKW
jgi:cyanate lyase